ncbi:excalibur calcium-binding domain-containing protein [Antribacter sp. KLBMP9083]|uniref:Excalibur calcium-binding domain-containing protein n=1 Tax=Antribacter soli TaxID=2910976 RepID=A0AA41QC33_9MICO|nr:excalibur calcium-binding domain-containing protein [Antribacter soli]MCF4120386.1 excalibur calcium-binding domain-containing protein [Antribacter soli]
MAAMTGSLAVSTAAPAAADWYQDGVFALQYTDELWRVDSASDTARQLTFDEWAALGFPTPQPAPTSYVKYSWSPTVYAVTFFGDERDEWLWEQISFGQWSRAGYPSPWNAGWIEGSYFYKWGTSSELFVEGPDGVNHKLSHAEWQASGFMPPADRSNEGFVKYTWDSTIVRMTNFGWGQGYAIGYDEWRSEAFPTPQAVTRVAGDQVYRYYGNPTIWYAGPGLNRPITGAEWQAMGFPAPTVYGVPPRPADKDCADFATQAQAQAEYNYYFEAYGDVWALDGDGDHIVCEWLP